MKRGASFLSKRLASWRKLFAQYSSEFGAGDPRTVAARDECSRLAAGLIAGSAVLS